MRLTRGDNAVWARAREIKKLPVSASRHDGYCAPCQTVRPRRKLGDDETARRVSATRRGRGVDASRRLSRDYTYAADGRRFRGFEPGANPGLFFSFHQKGTERTDEIDRTDEQDVFLRFVRLFFFYFFTTLQFRGYDTITRLFRSRVKTTRSRLKITFLMFIDFFLSNGFKTRGDAIASPANPHRVLTLTLLCTCKKYTGLYACCYC